MTKLKEEVENYLDMNHMYGKCSVEQSSEDSDTVTITIELKTQVPKAHVVKNPRTVHRYLQFLFGKI